MAPVTLRGIRKRYDDGKAVIQGVDLDIRDGEFMVFVGPSGCGKSTMLRMIAGLEDITEGELRIGDRVANDIPASRRGVAMVFQSYALYPHLTVEENMGFSLKMAGLGRAAIREQVGRVAEILQLGAVLDRKPSALSGGQRQRVAIGRAIVRSPDVFLFDEPLSNLDAGLRGQMRIELTRLHRELGTTMIYVTHDQTEAMTMGDRIAVFHQGRIEQVGEPMALYRLPANRFVARFLGSPRMNVAEARAVPGDGGWGLQVLGLGRIPMPGLSAGFAERVAGVGVRPEQLELVPAVEPGWDVATEAVERLGDTTLVHLAVPAAAEPWALKLPGDRPPPSPGDAVRVAPAAGGLYLFDAEGRVIHPN